MRKIIAGQIMMWANLCCVVIGYVVFQNTGITSEYVNGLLGWLGALGSFFNLTMSILIQIKGHSEKGTFKI